MTTPNCSTQAEEQGLTELPLGGRFELFPAFAGPENASLSLFREAFHFEQRSIVLFGKPIVQPRLISWAGDRPYTYSGDTLAPRPFPPAVLPLLDRINESLLSIAPDAPSFNHVLANYYRDGNDSMGLHSDDERELGPDPWIASLSLGAERCFQIAPKRKYRKRGERAEKLNISLPSGSLLLMHPPMQRYYLHGIQKTKRLIGPRLNLTFRAIER